MIASHLGPRGKAFWGAVQARYEFEPAESELLVEVCRVLDIIELLQAEITKTAPKQAKTAPKQPKNTEKQPQTEGKLPLSALRELRASRVLLQRLLAQLALPDAAGEVPLSLRQQQARRAAQRRWALHRGRDAAS